MAKKSFVMYKSWGDMIKNFDDATAGKLFKAVYAYQETGEASIDDPMLNAIFSMMVSAFDENDRKYQERCEKNRMNVQQRWHGNAYESIETNTNVYERIQTHTNYTDTDTDSDSDINKKKTPKGAKEKDPKHYHGEKVLLTDAEYERLKADYGEEKTEKAIAYLNDYIVEKQYKSKSHNLALRRWVFDAVDEQDQRREKMKAPRSGTTKFNQFEQRKYDYDAMEKMLLGGSGA